MPDIGSMSMVSYYNPIGLYRQQQQAAEQQQLAQQSQQPTQQAQQHAGTSSPDGPQQYWYGYPHGYSHAAHHHQTPGAQQYLDHPDAFPNWAHHAHHYSQIHYHQAAAYQQQQQQQQQQPQTSQISGVSNEWSGDEAASAVVVAGEPSPPITISGSEISNPGTPTTPTSSNNNGSNNTSLNNSSASVNNNNNNNRTPNTTPVRPAQVRSPYEWMKKTSYQSQPHPGKTRTKDKYRVVYTDHQRLELEKEFHYNRYITMRRKSELAGNLGLSERQVKIWFQNRRAKQRKQLKKREEMDQKELKSLDGLSSSAMAAAINLDGSSHNAMAALNLGALGAMPGMGGMHNGMMPDGSPPHGLPHQPHPLALTHSHPQHAAHSHTILGL